MIPVVAFLAAGIGYAGETYVEPAPAPAPAPAPSLWHWFVGGSVAYLDDIDDELWSFHVGAEKMVGDYSHALFLEIGWTGDDISGLIIDPIDPDYTPFNPSYKADVDLIPITLNYKFEAPLFGSEKFHWYGGGGIGAMYGDVDLDFYDDLGYLGGRSNDDWVFMAQVSAGIVWNLSERLEVFGGGRYIWLDDIDVGNLTYDPDGQAVGEIGLRYNF